MRRVRLPAGGALDAAWSRGAEVRACYVVEGRLAVGGTTVDAGTLVELDPADPAPVATGPRGCSRSRSGPRPAALPIPIQGPTMIAFDRDAADPAFELVRGDAPLLVSMPHVGTGLPPTSPRG